MKKVMVAVVALLGWTLFSTTSQAAEVEMSEVMYDLFETDSKTYDIIDKDGEEVTIEIEPLPSLSRISKGTYKVTKTLKGKWTISFNVGINTKEQFTSATKLSAISLSGSFTSTSLNHTTSSATCSFKRKVNTTTASGSVKASISKGKLVVS